MIYKDALFFIAKCLTISHDEKNSSSIAKYIESGLVDWEVIVKASTSHYVFPALYLNLKRASLLTKLPKELVAYMEHIAELNRERNLQIIKQAKEINTLLQTHGITPVFLKGTGFLLQDFYGDIAERMTGDIDFLVDKDSFPKAVAILKDHGYKKTSDKLSNPILSKHYPRLFHEDKIAAVEVHIEMVKEGLVKQFNYETARENLLHIDSFTVLGYEDQLTLTILAKQYNDHGAFFKTISLRNSYDVFLLSQKIDTTVVKDRYRFFFKYLNPYLGLTSFFFNSESVKYINNQRAKNYLKTSLMSLKYSLIRNLRFSFWKAYIYCRIKLVSLFRFISNKEFRNYYLKKISSS